ncbi:MAG TPA: hypothetical protein VMV46_13350 [Thermoanaerobaculia bacterium]|nr:hypothetical protein [Thermoanaerobaculia bacterium]
MSYEIVIGGLDGATPLGFLASLGALTVLSERPGESDGGSPPRLSWRQLDTWRPVLHGDHSFEQIVDALWDDVVAWEDHPVLGFRYLKLEKRGSKPVGGLRAPLAVLRAWLVARREAGDEGSLACSAALMCETANELLEKDADRDSPLDRVTLPTYFDFTSRNAQFLEQLGEIRSALSRDLIAAELETGKPDPAAPRSMDWDPMADTPGAIYTGYTRGFLPVSEWLAFRGLVHFPVTGDGATLRTTACTGRRKSGTFVWPLWNRPASAGAVGSLVAYPGLEELSATARQALGIVSVLRAGLVKKADGYSGMFSPAEPVQPPATIPRSA